MDVPAKPNEETTRRHFLGWMVRVVNGATGLLLAVPLIGYTLSPLLRRAGTLWVTLGPLSSISKTPVPRRVRFEYDDTSGYKKKRAVGVAWVMGGEAGPVIYAPACTHKGCNFDWSDAEKMFLCPCHGGRFAATGEVRGGPPPRPLDRYETREQGGNLMIRIDRVLKNG